MSIISILFGKNKKLARNNIHVIVFITNENNNAPKLYFNYNLTVSEELMKQEYHRDNNFEIICPDDDGITITL